MQKHKHITGPVLAEMFARNVRVNDKGRPDGADCRAVSDALYGDSRIAKLAAEMHRDQPEVFAAAGGYGSRRARAGGIGREMRDGRVAELSAREQEPGMRTLPGCETGILCDGDILGFSTLGAGIDPTLGPAAPGAVAVSPEIQVDSGNASRYQGHYFFWEGRDRANDFEVTPTYLLSATIGGEQQLVGGGGAQNGITNSVFALTDIPLDIGWKRFGDTSATTLRLIMGNYIPGTELDYNFVWWGNVATAV